MSELRVSGIMPTRGRPAWAAAALAGFLRQTYTAKELVIMDDQEAPSFPDPPVLPNVKYSRVPGHEPIPTKRNRCCHAASGDIIMHFDDDDWSAPARMTDQVDRLFKANKSVTGYRSLLFWDEQRGEASRYVGSATYALGTSLAYYRVWWAAHPFRDRDKIGEDNDMVWTANGAGELVTIDGGGLMVARIHPGNTSRKDASGYARVALDELPAGMFE